MTELKKTLLEGEFVKIEKEYEAVKKNAGLFDLSHIGKIEIKGKDAFSYIQNLITNDIGQINENQGLYTLMCYPYGAVLEALILYKFSNNHFLLVINSGNIDKTFKWLINRKRYQDVSIINISNSLYQLALHGPKSYKIIQKLTNTNINEIERFSFKENINICGKNCLISRMGYTGEDGFEIYTSTENSETVLKKILKEGKEEGIRPAGIETRDVLRYEANLPLFGDELIEDITPLEAGFHKYIKLDKHDFVGKNALEKQNKKGITRKVVSFQIKDKKNILSQGAGVFANNKKVGSVTAWHFSPDKKENIGLAVVDLKYADMGTVVFIKSIDELVEAKVIA